MKFINVSKDVDKMRVLLDSGEMDELPRDAAMLIQACTELDIKPSCREISRQHHK